MFLIFLFFHKDISNIYSDYKYENKYKEISEHVYNNYKALNATSKKILHEDANEVAVEEHYKVVFISANKSEPLFVINKLDLRYQLGFSEEIEYKKFVNFTNRWFVKKDININNDSLINELNEIISKHINSNNKVIRIDE